MNSLIAITVLLFLNGFFVAAEFALVKARGVRIEHIAMSGNSSARLTLRIQKNLEAYLAACQLGITMASLGLGWIGEPAVAAILTPLLTGMQVPETVIHSASFLLGFLVFSSLHIIVGEQVPKTFAIRKAERVALWIAYPLHLSYLIVWPLNWLLNKASRSILSLFNVDEATHGDVFSDQELKGLVSTSQDHGNIEQNKGEMLQNLFDFDQRAVGKVMIPRNAVQVLDLAASAATNQRIVLESGHSRFPLIDGGRNDEILGVVLVKQLYHAALKDGVDPWENLSHYCRDPLIVPETQKVSQLFELMREQHSHFAFVVDEYGSMRGIVTLEDLLEEIVGDIEDETDASIPDNLQITNTANGLWEASGMLSLADLQRTIGIRIDSDIEANTLSGLLMERFGSVTIRQLQDTDSTKSSENTVAAETPESSIVDKQEAESFTEKPTARDID
ncbi:MAG: HlyC/CorC family transporter [Pseudomonadales bacterium]|nr:HlyC/CorC family transporter [Pseudomonadales bacterium]